MITARVLGSIWFWLLVAAVLAGYSFLLTLLAGRSARIASLFRGLQSDGVAFWRMGGKTTRDDLRSTPAVLRIVLYGGEVCRLPRSCRGVRVLSGNAWITADGRDILLSDGERTTFASGKDQVIVSGLGNAPLVLEAQKDNAAYVFTSGRVEQGRMIHHSSAETPAQAI